MFDVIEWLPARLLGINVPVSAIRPPRSTLTRDPLGLLVRRFPVSFGRVKLLLLAKEFLLLEGSTGEWEGIPC